MKIWFDARMLGFSGIGVQVEQSLRLLLKRRDRCVVPLGPERTIRQYFPDYAGPVIPFEAKIYGLREQLLYPAPDAGTLLHVPHYAAPIMHLGRSVVVVHDLIHLQSDEFRAARYRLYTTALLKAVTSRARAVIAVSHYTRNCLVERFPSVAARVHVIHNGIDHSLFRPVSLADVKAFRNLRSLPPEYLLTVGIGKRHKNLDFVVRSLAPLWKQGKLKMPLVMAGTGGTLPDYVSAAVRECNVADRIVLLPRLADRELGLMYRGARALIMPSLLEGFGFPVVEAMACGTPVLSSNRASLPEVGGDAALYFDPENAEDLREKLLNFLRLPSLGKAMSERGKRNASRYTWQEHVALLMSLYNRLEQNRA